MVKGIGANTVAYTESVLRKNKKRFRAIALDCINKAKKSLVLDNEHFKIARILSDATTFKNQLTCVNKPADGVQTSEPDLIVGRIDTIRDEFSNVIASMSEQCEFVWYDCCSSLNGSGGEVRGRKTPKHDIQTMISKGILAAGSELMITLTNRKVKSGGAYQPRSIQQLFRKNGLNINWIDKQLYTDNPMGAGAKLWHLHGKISAI